VRLVGNVNRVSGDINDYLNSCRSKIKVKSTFRCVRVSKNVNVCYLGYLVTRSCYNTPLIIYVNLFALWFPCNVSNI
jgi:hypothetical protein